MLLKKLGDNGTRVGLSVVVLEVPIAFVELEEGYEETTQAFIKSQLKERLAAFKIPKTITVVESLPKTATGKVLKRVLKQGLH